MAEPLRRLAALAAGQPEPVGSGRFAYVRTRGLYRSADHLLRADGSLRLLAERTEPAEREFWIAPDGSGRIEETRSGERTGTSRVYGPGELHAEEPLPADPDELERLLARRMNRGTFSWLKAVRSAWNSRVVEPRLQAKLLEVLARQPDLDWRGDQEDPIGRHAVAVGTGTESRQQTLFLDPDTGMLLADIDSGYTAWLFSGYVESTDDRPAGGQW